ncbi:MAG: ribosome silencing factor [Caldimonas sp.]
MDIRKLQRVIVDGLEDVKGQNIVVFNTEHLSPLFERVIVASGTSNRQTKSLAASVRDAVKAAGDPPPRTEGEDNGEWIIVDCGAAVVHVMQPAIREYYHLEELWGDKPVKMKIASAAPRLVKAAATPEHREAAAPRPSARRAAADHRPAARPAAAKRAKPVARAKPAPRVAPSRTTPAKRVVIRTSGVKSAAAKAARTGARPAAKKAAAKKAAAKR